MKTKFMLLNVLATLTYLPVSAEIITGGRAVVAPVQSAAMTLTGAIEQNQKTKAMGYNLTLGGVEAQYELKGVAPFRDNPINDTLKFNAIAFHKKAAGRNIIAYSNGGVLAMRSTGGRLPELTLANAKVVGKYTFGEINRGIFFDGDLTVDGVPARGEINYQDIQKRFVADSSLSFGAYAIRNLQGNAWIMKYANNLKESRQKDLVVQMQFGELIVNGRIELKNKTEDTTAPGFMGAQMPAKKVVAITGYYNLSITKLDGSLPKISSRTDVESADEANLRALLAFLELTASDIYTLDARFR